MKKAKKAMITGITGQDGSYLVEFLLKKGYEVHGLRRRSSSVNLGRIEHIVSLPKFQHPHKREKEFFLHYGDVTDSSNLLRLLKEINPDEIYHLAAQSHVKYSFETPEYTAEADAIGTLRLLEAIRILDLKEKTRFYNASTSELFGKVRKFPQNENTPFHARSPYATAKLYAHWVTVNYREAYNIFTCNGILFNHESPRRGTTFLTRKVSLSVAKIVLGLEEKLYVGNLNAERDWGYAPEYVKAMWLMLQKSKPDDYVVATGESHSVKEFIKEAFSVVDIDIEFKGKGIREKGYNKSTGKVLVEVDPWYFRPAEVDKLVGDYSKAKRELGWEPKTKFKELVKIMVKEDIKQVSANRIIG